ncbi:hypothetical protein WAE61_19780 [Comamonadaceae bacterium PP-2]
MDILKLALLLAFPALVWIGIARSLIQRGIATHVAHSMGAIAAMLVLVGALLSVSTLFKAG